MVSLVYSVVFLCAGEVADVVGQIGRMIWKWATEEQPVNPKRRRSKSHRHLQEEKSSRGPLMQYEIIPDLVSECSQESGLFVEYRDKQITMGSVFQPKLAQSAPKVCLFVAQTAVWMLNGGVFCRSASRPTTASLCIRWSWWTQTRQYVVASRC